MAVVPILQDGDERLRGVALPVSADMFGGKELAGIVADMKDTLDREPDGVAIAAPQIGVSYRIFLVRYDRMLPSPKEGEPERPADIGVYINPEIVKAARKAVKVDEGCLSVRGLYGKTMRKERATVRAYDESGKKFERGGGGVLAQAFQHEIDHLNGILFVDHATDIVEAEIPEKPRAQMEHA